MTVPDTAIAAAARRAGIPYATFRRLVYTEASGRHYDRPGHLVTSGAGAQGAAQLMPGTARELERQHPGLNTRTPAGNLLGGAYYLRQQLDRFGNMRDALAAYNAGPGNRQAGYGYADKILGGVGAGGGPAAAPPPAPTSPGIGLPAASGGPQALAMELIRQIQSRERPNALSAVQAFQGVATPTEQIPAPASPGTSTNGFAPPGRADLTNWTAGSPVPGGKAGGEHDTDGLPGFRARDYFGKPGSAVVAPQGGTIVKLSGHDPRLGAVQGPGGPLGWSVYIRGDDGRVYYLTHLGSRSVKQGQRVRPGQVIGTIANYDRYGRPSHVHMGVHGG